jgi:hypothetical protein
MFSVVSQREGRNATLWKLPTGMRDAVFNSKCCKGLKRDVPSIGAFSFAYVPCNLIGPIGTST